MTLGSTRAQLNITDFNELYRSYDHFACFRAFDDIKLTLSFNPKLTLAAFCYYKALKCQDYHAVTNRFTHTSTDV